MEKKTQQKDSITKQLKNLFLRLKFIEILIKYFAEGGIRTHDRTLMKRLL